MRTLAVAAVLLAFACSKKDDKAGAPAGDKPADPGAKTSTTAPTPPAAPHYADTTALWNFAPADASGGIVVGDGVLGRVLDAAAVMVKDLDGKPWAKKII